MASSLSKNPPPSNLPLRPIPGDYGLPFFGAISDRLDYFYKQGIEKFFQSRIDKHKSTIFKTNMPPGPFIAPNPKVIAILDAISFPILFDTSRVEKYNVFVATYFPSVSFTGGHRVCAYLDPSEPKHTTLKSFLLSLLAKKHDQFIPLFRTCLSELFIDLEDEMDKKKEAYFNTISDNMSFNYVFRLICDQNPVDTEIGTKGSSYLDKWMVLQLVPLATLGLPKFLNFFEDILLHTFPMPYFLVKSDYKKVYDAFYKFSGPILDQAEGFGVKREEACHNLVFFFGFNAYGGMKTTFPSLIKWVGLAGEKLHRELADEIRTVVHEEGGVTFKALDRMTLTKSVVYEALRIEPPVPAQYGKAKEDIVVQSHEASFLIKKGEMICGYQPFATKDPRVFENPQEFVGHRFVGEEGEKLLKYVYWSNGRETDNPTAENKQCPGKDLVVLLCRVMLVEFFLRYDTFTVEAGTLLLGSTATFKSLTKATSI
ncbi:p450 domain-containing protein [Cephalotus follicularis]|uniref:p450 domain-containing protein n=1 Tax=Cephalotus follicularis TaxID=3775 RepID=A0A1Q3C4N6_CEPFO|nr:p450 domain-containing protein [Cephalotus follicularis]GAV90075.1 p450 domain-containing protein [Cephalotus follicularis]